MDGDSRDEAMRLTADDPLAGLMQWLADERVDAAASGRSRRRWLERQADEEATIAGVLADLAERAGPVAVRTMGGRTARGEIVALGADFAVVREERIGDVVIPVGSVATIRSAPGEEPAVGDRAPAFAVALVDALAEMAADRRLVLVAVGGDEIRGELRTAGTDVVALTTAATTRDMIHIAVAAIDHLVLLGR